MTVSLPPTITGIILAGGQGRRMGGNDKALQLYQQRPLVEYALTALRPQVEKLIINANRHHDQYQQYGYPIVADELDNYQGPLAGILTALRQASTPYILTVPCDSPFLPECYRQRMMESMLASGAQLAVAVDDKRIHPAFCLLHHSLLDSLASYLVSGERKLETWLKQHPLVEVDFSDHPAMFINMNTPDDLQIFPPIQSPLPVLGFAAFSGTGKTTLLTKLLPELNERGIRVAVIKHAHHQFDIDKPGKDSYEIREAGAKQMLIASSRMMALIEKRFTEEREPILAELIKRVDIQHLDLILVEGFKHEHFAKIELHRPSLDKPLMCVEDPHIIAVASDASLDNIGDLPLLNINDIHTLANFIELFIIKWKA